MPAVKLSEEQKQAFKVAMKGFQVYEGGRTAVVHIMVGSHNEKLVVKPLGVIAELEEKVRARVCELIPS